MLNIANGEDILYVTLFTNEALVNLSGYINSQNICVWSSTNPYELNGTPLYEQKIGVYSPVPYHEIR